MATVAETELEQKVSEFMVFVRAFVENRSRDFALKGNHEQFKFSIFDNDVTLEFEI